MKAKAAVEICGWGHDSWKVAEPTDPKSHIRRCDVILEIVGNAKDGYHLNMSPKGFFTADSWHPTIEEAKEAAYRCFGVALNEWS